MPSIETPPSFDPAPDAVRKEPPPANVAGDPPPTGLRTFDELPIEMQEAAFARQRRLDDAILNFEARRRREMKIVAVVGAAVMILAAYGIGGGGFFYYVFAAMIGAAAGATASRLECERNGFAATFIVGAIALSFLAPILGLCAPTWSTGFFTWVLVGGAGVAAGDFAEHMREGF